MNLLLSSLPLSFWIVVLNSLALILLGMRIFATRQANKDEARPSPPKSRTSKSSTPSESTPPGNGGGLVGMDGLSCMPYLGSVPTDPPHSLSIMDSAPLLCRASSVSMCIHLAGTAEQMMNRTKVIIHGRIATLAFVTWPLDYIRCWDCAVLEDPNKQIMVRLTTKDTGAR